jgi:hypothetical protein
LRYRGLPKEFREEGPPPTLEGAEWSADGAWLALLDRAEWDPEEQREIRRVMLMRPDGSGAHEMKVGIPWDQHNAPTWTWAARGSLLLWLEPDGSLIRYHPETQQASTLWRAPTPEGVPDEYEIIMATLSPSPEGRWLSVDLIYHHRADVGPGIAIRGRDEDPYVRRLWIVSADGRDSHLVDTDGGYRDQIWSLDGSTLYLERVVQDAEWSLVALEILAWNSAGGDTSTAVLPEERWARRIVPLPTGSLLVSGGERLWEVTPEGEARALPDKLHRALAAGSWLGLDDKGRMVVDRTVVAHFRGGGVSPDIAVVDIATGQTTRIYP